MLQRGGGNLLRGRPPVSYVWSHRAEGRGCFTEGKFEMSFLRNVSLAVVIGTMLATPVAALDRRVTIVNETGFTMTNFYGSNTGSNSWEEDILGQDVLPSGSQVSINFNDQSGYCMFDFKAVFEDGDELIRERVNVCEVSTFTYN
jgi:hypothetical protein